jgi:dTDP-D-glucose 4,6-dehydratase
MIVLVYGGNGWIGSQFIKIVEREQIQYFIGKSRVDNNEELINEIKTINPTHIVSFIGRTHGKIGDKIFSTIDYLEEEGKLVENIRDNLYSPLILAADNYDEWIEYMEDRPFNDKRYYISNQKLRDLGWEIKEIFMESLQKLC